MFATTFKTESLMVNSIYTFCYNFFGEVLVGIITSFIVGYFMSWIEEETLIVISLTANLLTTCKTALPNEIHSTPNMNPSIIR